MTCVYVEQGDLDGGVGIVFRTLKTGHIRLMYDPGQMTETAALEELRERLPQHADTKVVSRA